MKKEVILLKYIDNNTDDTLILGFFCKKKIEETILFYKTLSGFSKGTGKFIYDNSLFIEGNSVYLLQIWNKYDDSIIYKNTYETKKDAQNHLEFFINSNNEQNYDFAIDQYIVDEREWSEGFVTFEKLE